MSVRVKICCIANPAEADLAVRAGAWALGLVAEMPSGPGPIPDEAIAEIIPGVPDGIETFLLTSRTDADAIIDHHHVCGTSALQLVDDVPHDHLRKIRRQLPEIKLIQVIHVTDEASIDRAEAVSPWVDMVLLDSGKPLAAVKTLGGTGDTHDWRISREIVRRVACPVILAGGLNVDNVLTAISRVRPYGVDVCSGLRPNGRLNAERARAFCRAAGSAMPERA